MPFSVNLYAHRARPIRTRTQMSWPPTNDLASQCLFAGLRYSLWRRRSRGERKHTCHASSNILALTKDTS
eukprot:438725-Amphidinium_carterae.1